MANNPQFSGGGQYHDDKTRIKDAMKLGKITMVMATRRIKGGKRTDRKHQKRHQSATCDANSDKDGKEESKKSRRHISDGKKLRKHAYTPESDVESHESRQKRHKRDNQDGSYRNGGYEELEDGELGEDGEIRKQPMAAEIDI